MFHLDKAGKVQVCMKAQYQQGAIMMGTKDHCCIKSNKVHVGMNLIYGSNTGL